jgi:hypothetical protein
MAEKQGLSFLHIAIIVVIGYLLLGFVLGLLFAIWKLLWIGAVIVAAVAIAAYLLERLKGR